VGTEQDFIEILRIWAEVMRDGTFPEAIGTENAMKQMPVLVQKVTQMQVSEEKGTEIGMSFARGMLFHQTVNDQGQFLETDGIQLEFLRELRDVEHFFFCLAEQEKPLTEYPSKESVT